MTTTIKKTTTVTTRYERTVTVAEILHALGLPLDATLSSTNRYACDFDAEDKFDVTWATTEQTEEPPRNTPVGAIEAAGDIVKVRMGGQP